MPSDIEPRIEMYSGLAGKTTAWILALVLLGANIAGYRYDLYAMFWWFDRVLHGATLFAVTYWLAVVVFAPALNGDHRVRAFLLLAAAGIACGALWEVTEWGFDQIQPGDVIKGKYDSILDIVMDTIGAGLAAALAMIFLRDRWAYARGAAGRSSPYGGFPTSG